MTRARLAARIARHATRLRRGNAGPGRTLGENELQLDQQAALLRAAQVVTSELRLETVLQLLVDEVTQLLSADAAHCYLYDARRQTLRCAAVRGLDPNLVGFEFHASAGISGRAVAEGKPVVANEYGTVQKRIPHPAYEDFQRAIAAPMIWAGETRGVLAAASRDTARLFGQPDAELLAAFASLASLALRNAEAFAEHERQARSARGLATVLALLGESVSLPETVDAIAQAAAEALDGSFAAVLLPVGRGIHLSGSFDLPPELEVLRDGLPEGAEVLAEAAQSGRMLSFSLLADDERLGESIRSLAAQVGFRSLLAAPLAIPRSEAGGIVLVGFDAARQFSDEDVELARQLASAAGGALERSELFETERRARDLSQQLTAIGSRLGTKLEPGAVLQEVVAHAVALLAVDAASIRLLEDGALVVAAAAGSNTEELIGASTPAAAEPAATVIRSDAPLALEEVSGDARLVAGDPFLATGRAAYLGVPLHGSEGGLQGVLAVYSHAHRVWRTEESEALGALAVIAAATFSNAELYERVLLERERSNAILGSVADGIVAVDGDGSVLLWNAAAEQITGVPSSEAQGRTLIQVLQRDLSHEAAPAGERHVSIRRGSEEVHLSLTEAVMRDTSGEVVGRVFAFRDISREHAIEQMRSDFVSTVSHELRAPLTSIYGFAETLRRRDVEFSDAERSVFLGYVASEASRLTGIVDQLLNVARLETGDLHLELAPTDVRPVVSEVVAIAEQAAFENGHRFVVELPDEPVAAHADVDRLRQILVNLVDNAIKFSPAGGTVRITAHRAGETVEVSVADQGIGIPPAERDRIFTKFYRLAGEGQTGGAGLGLSIAQGLVAAMGGQIKVESAEGEGSTFVVELPAARAVPLGGGRGAQG